MDKATRRYKARENARRTKRGQLSPFDSRGLGRKNKPPEVFVTPRCTHVTGAKKVAYRKFSKARNELVLIVRDVGGSRCLKDAVVNGKCLAHIAPPETQTSDNPNDGRRKVKGAFRRK